MVDSFISNEFQTSRWEIKKIFYDLRLYLASFSTNINCHHSVNVTFKQNNDEELFQVLQIFIFLQNKSVV